MPKNTVTFRTIFCHFQSRSIFLYVAIVFLLLSLAIPLNAKETLRVGVYENKPLIFTGENGQVSGLFPEILEHIANEEGWKIDYVHGHWDQIFHQVQQGEIDLLPAIAYSASRADHLSFSDQTLMVNWAEIYTTRDYTISSLLDLEGKRVAVKMDDIHFTALKELTEKFSITCRFIETDGYTTIFEMLDANYIDIGVVNRLFGRANRKDFGVKVSPVIFNPIELRFASAKGKNQDILSIIDARMMSYTYDPNSIYHQAILQWLGTEQTSYFPSYLKYIIGGMVAVFLLLFGLNILLRHQVAKQTNSLSKTNRHLQLEISKRHKIMQELKKYARVVEASSDAIALFDRDHNHLLVNSAYLSAFGFNRDELQETTLLEVVGAEFYETYLEEPIRRCLRGEQATITATSSHKEQSSKHWHIHLGPYTVSENFILGYAINIRDISQQVELEQQLKTAQKMEAVGLLAGGVAHDLNNILSGIVSYPDMLLINRATDDPMYLPLQTIKNSGQRAAAIVSDLLTLARRGVENTQPTNFNTLINEYINSPEYTAMLDTTSGVEVALALEDQLLHIMGSPVHLAKCITNLITHGLEAMPHGGTLTITTINRYLEQAEVPYREMVAGEYVLFSVSDTGVGMDKEKLARIFEPFFTSKVMGRSGTGLGMALVWSGVKDHNGHIQVESTPGTGTTFTLYFPATRKTGSAVVEQDFEEHLVNGEKVLVIDDMEEQRDIASKMLLMLGYMPDSAESGEAAIEKVRHQEYDILVLDMIMPGGMDGLSTYKKILRENPNQKAIIASGFSDTASVTEAQALGAGAYVRKPYTVASLAAALKKELHPDTV